jgi:hypothetical protein
MAEVKARLRPPTLESIKAAYDRARGEERGERFRLEEELRRATQEEKWFDHLYTTENDENAEVRAKLSGKWKDAIRRCESLKAKLMGEQPIGKTVFDDEEAFKQFHALASDIDRLVDASLPAERKRLVEALVRTVWVEEYSPYQIIVRIIWKDASPDTTIYQHLRGYAYRRILDLDAAGKTGKQIAELLKASGLVTAFGREWCERLVNAALERLRKSGLPEAGKRRKRRETETKTESGGEYQEGDPEA